MALQDDIMALLSQVGDAGDRATDRGRRGEELYDQIADRLSGDNRSKALREIAMLSSNPEMSIEEQMRFDPLTGSRVADIIEKYMDDVEDGVSTPVPDDMIVDDTRAAERMMEVMPSPDTAPRTPVSVEELPPMSRPELDEVAMASMAREFGGKRQMNQERLREMGLSSIEGGDVPLRDRLMEGQGEPMSGTEQIMFASSLIPVAALPAAAARIGMGAAQIARYLRAGKTGEDALRQVIRQRTKARMMRDPATGRMIGAKDIGPQPQAPLNRMMSQAESGGVPAGMYAEGGPIGMAGGMSVRDKILKTYGGM